MPAETWARVGARHRVSDVQAAGAVGAGHARCGRPPPPSAPCRPTARARRPRCAQPGLCAAFCEGSCPTCSARLGRGGPFLVSACCEKPGGPGELSEVGFRAVQRRGAPSPPHHVLDTQLPCCKAQMLSGAVIQPPVKGGGQVAKHTCAPQLAVCHQYAAVAASGSPGYS